jgi:PAS domain S-box-containing protein
VVNNEFDALSVFEKAYSIYSQKISKKSGTVPYNEQTTYGENTATGIVVLGSTPSEVGKVVHANGEVSYLFGFHPKELIGKNVTAIMPVPVGAVHQSFIHDYFDTAKSRGVINNIIQHFGCSYEGYLRIFQVIVKVYP